MLLDKSEQPGSDAVTKMFHKAYAKRLTEQDMEILSNWIFSIDPDDGNIFLLIEAVGYAVTFGFSFKKNIEIFEKIKSWTNKKYNPALAGTCLHALVFKWNWYASEAKNLILDFLTPSDWDECLQALGSAISAASIYLERAGCDTEINTKLNHLLKDRNIPKDVKQQIMQMCGSFLKDAPT